MVRDHWLVSPSSNPSSKTRLETFSSDAVALAAAGLVGAAMAMPASWLASTFSYTELAREWGASAAATAVSVTVAAAILCLPSAVESLYSLLALPRLRA